MYMKLDANDINREAKTKWAIFRMWLVYLHHIVVSKTTLACTAAYNANTHPERFVLANLDQPVIFFCFVSAP